MDTMKQPLAWMLALTLQTDIACAYCVESGPDGALAEGAIAAEECESLFDNLEDDTRRYGKQLELFIAQENEGHYYKICNSSAMKTHFKANFGIAAVKPTCTTVCLSSGQIAARYCGEDKRGIRSFQYLGKGEECMKVKVCEFGS